MTDNIECKFHRILKLGSIKSIYRNKRLVFYWAWSNFSDVSHWKEKVSKVRSGEAEDKDYVCSRQNFVMALKEDYIFKWHAWACVPCVFLWLSIKPNRTTSAGLVGSRHVSQLKESKVEASLNSQKVSGQRRQVKFRYDKKKIGTPQSDRICSVSHHSSNTSIWLAWFYCTSSCRAFH